MDFSGVKIALICDQQLITILRDNKPGLRFANMWDLPGGGRENNETTFACAAREVQEELGIDISGLSVLWEHVYQAMHDPTQHSYFMVAAIPQTLVNGIVFGDEGQRWKMQPINEFLHDPQVIPQLQTRLQDYLKTTHGRV